MSSDSYQIKDDVGDSSRPKSNNTTTTAKSREELAKRQDQDYDRSTAAAEIEVHSANSWETADLGDQGRNNKFLRLMGAAKKQHHGRFVIGDQNPANKRSSSDSRHLNEDLESQYEHSMEHRLVGGRRGHIGLGFAAEGGDKKEGEGAKPEDSLSDKGRKVDQEQYSSDNVKSNKDFEEAKADDRKRVSTDTKLCVEEKKMKFVKSSS